MSYFDYFRYPNTKNEMKQYYASLVNEENLRIKVRGRHKPKSLPHAWDDIYRSNMFSKNWKSYRRHQWKTIR